jgi:choline-sulfatase
MPMGAPARSSRSRWRCSLILVAVCLAVVAAAAAGWRFARTSGAASNGPVIVISIDSLRADRLPAYGYHDGRAPSMDALAADGIVFDHAYSHSPLTLPAHVSLLSGQLPFETGVREDEGAAVRADTLLLPQLVRAYGYRSGAFVSSAALAAGSGLARAFDVYDADIPVAAGRPITWCTRNGEATLAAAKKWIVSLASAKFLLFLHLADVAPARVSGRAGETGHSGQTPGATSYDDEVAYEDAIVGQFVKTLKGRGLYDRATIILVAPHGEGLVNGHGEQGHGLFLYDETVRVPLIVKLPRNEHRRTRVAEAVQHIDLVPTILGLLDAPVPQTVRGHRLDSLAFGRPGGVQTPAHAGVYAEALRAHHLFGWAPLRSLTVWPYRYISAPREELYDLQADPRELRNLAGERSDVVQGLREALEAMTVDDRPKPAPAGRGEADPKEKLAVYENYQLAQQEAAGGQLQRAAASYRVLLSTEPGCARAWLELARTLDRANRFSDAASAYDRLVALTPDSAMGWLGAGQALLKAGKLDAARSRGERAAAIEGGRGHELLARVALEQKYGAEALRQAEMAERAEPGTAVTAFVRGVQLYGSGDYETALPLLQQAATPTAPGSRGLADASAHLADTLERLERYAEAEAAWKEEIRQFPYNLRARVSLAMLYHVQHRDDASEAAIDAMVDAMQSPETYAAAARLWTIFGEKDRAAAARAEAGLLFGRDAQAASPSTDTGNRRVR